MVVKSIKNDEVEDLTPYGSTGCVDTIENGLRALVDWVGVTFKDVFFLEDVSGILGIPIREFELQEKGFRGYKESATFGSILVAWNGGGDKAQMGVHIEMSGQACREYEQRFAPGSDWSTFFALAMNFNHKFSRLDIALDDFKGYFSVEQLYRNAKRGCMTAHRVKKFQRFEECFVSNGETDGQTFYIGKSDWKFRFYDKLAERNNKGVNYYDALKVWNRYEIQLRNNLATEAAHVLAYEAYSLGAFAKGFFSSKIDFKINNKTDINKSRWKSQKFWLNFLDNCEKVELSQKAPDPSIPRKKHWLDTAVVKTLATYYHAMDQDDNVLDFLIEKGSEKMGKQDFEMIKEFQENPSLKHIYKEEMMSYLFNNDEYKEKSLIMPPQQ